MTKNRIFAAIFALGAFSILAQVTFMREMLAVFLGNELTIGIILACWLAGIGFGALAARFTSGLLTPERMRRVLVAVLLVGSIALPFQVYLIRISRHLMGVPAGEFASFSIIGMCALFIFLPASFGIGLFFPFACEIIASQSRISYGIRGISLIYTFESLGAMAGGVVLTYILLPVLSPLRVVLLASSIAAAGAVIIMQRRKNAYILTALTVCVTAVALIYPRWLKSVENWTVRAQWNAFDVLNEEQSESPAVRLVDWENTIYQNLAVTESGGQFTLYGNGRVLFTFPDPIEYEHNIHFLMAQNPGAKKVLLLGGNPVGDIPELLKYPLERLVYVDLDPGVSRMISRADKAGYDKISSDNRVTLVSEDGPRFVQSCTDKFDIVIVDAPEPVTSAANRFYTIEFYANIKRILAPGGFMFTALNSSERLQSATARLGASVYQSLKSVFPMVLVTAEARNRFFAGSTESHLSFNRVLLAEKHKESRVATKYFMSDYFIGADEIDSEKIEYVKERFESLKVPLNSNLKPITCFYNMLLWSEFSGSGVEGFLRKVMSVNYINMGRTIAVTGIILLLAGTGLRACRKRKLSDAWSRFMSGILIGTTGFCGMAMEILLIFVFQNLHGYIYARIGLIVAMFMLGLVTGAPSGMIMAGGRRWISWCAMACLELILFLLILIIPVLLSVASRPGAGIASQWSEWIIYLAVAFTGWVVGAEFPLVNKLFRDAGGNTGHAAAVTDAYDHAGGAIGAVAMGVVFVPVFGIGAACFLMATLQCVGILCLASAILTLPPVISKLRE